jgi:hypothetical protein
MPRRRWLRLGEVAPHEVIVVRCPCERSVQYFPGFLQRKHRVPSDFLVYDSQFRLLLALNSGLQSSLGAFDRDHPEAVRQTFIMCATRIPGLG